MGDNVYIASIVKGDYEAFRALMKDNIPNSYDGWLNQRSEWRKKYIDGGNAVVDVKISPDQFSSFAATTRQTCDMQTLARLAAEIGSRKTK